MSSHTPTTPSDPARAQLERAILDSLDGLLRALELESLGNDRFRGISEPARFADHMFGGQLISQALLAASRTVEQKSPHSLHAYFVEAGTVEQPVNLSVERVRDGRSISQRRINVTQGSRTLLVAMVSFHEGPTSPELAEPPPVGPPPEEVPVLQDLIREMPPERRKLGSSWIDKPPPIELRIDTLPNFMGGPCGRGPRAHWMRLSRDVGDDPRLHDALLAYASDYLVLDAVLRSHPEPLGASPFSGFSLDHALWLHRPVRFDRWHVYTQQAQSISGHRGLVRGFIHDADGHLVASVMQENLVRPPRG